jgi:hypothetical protein
MSGNQPQPSTPVLGNFNRDSGFHYLYANQVRMRVSPGELTLVFAYQDETPAGLMLTELASITLAPTVARRTSVLLSEILKEYEAKFGVIPPDPDTGIDGSDVLRRVDTILKAGTPD